MNDFFNFDDIKKHMDFIDIDKSKSFVKWIYSLSEYEFTATAALIGLMISPTLNYNEQIAIGNFLIEIGQVILTVNSHATVKSNKHNNGNNLDNIKSEFNRKLAILQKQINNLKNPK